MSIVRATINKSHRTKLSNQTTLICIEINHSLLPHLAELLSVAANKTSTSYILFPREKNLGKQTIQKALSNTPISVQTLEKKEIFRQGQVYLAGYNKNYEFTNVEIKTTNKKNNSYYKYESLAQTFGEHLFLVFSTPLDDTDQKKVEIVKKFHGNVLLLEPEDNANIVQGNGFNGIDHIVPIAELAEKVTDYFSGISDELNRNDNEAIQKIITYVSEQFNIDFSLYKRKSIIRKLERRMSRNKLTSFESYANLLLQDEQERNVLLKEFLIGLTGFFRNIEAFEFIRKNVIPVLFKKLAANEPLRLWVAGCSTGEEAYSTAILIHAFLTKNKLSVPIKIFATDVDDGAIQTASKGKYPISVKKDVPSEYFNNYFTTKGNYCYVKDELRAMIIFAKHNIISDPPFRNVDFVACRNLLIYFKPKLQENIINLFYSCLKSNGYLFLGPSEVAGNLGDAFPAVEKKWNLFCKKPSKNSKIETANNTVETQINYSLQNNRHPLDKHSLLDRLNEVLINEYGPMSAFIDLNFEVIQLKGGITKLLKLSEKKLSLNILKLVPSSVEIPIKTAIQKAIKTGEKVIYKNVPMLEGEKMQYIGFTVTPIYDRFSRQSFLLLVFDEIKELGMAAQSAQLHLDVDPEIHKRMQELELQLKDTQASLQITLDELEISNEKLQTSNEELQISNEDLLIANQEFQHANQELQSVNEELQTVNLELEEKINALTELNHDVNNLLKSTEIGVIFLDKNLKIRKFTPILEAQFGITNNNLGHHISRLAHHIEYPNFEQEITAIINNQKGEITQEIKHQNGKWYLTSIMPYKTEKLETEGAVITFTDISSVKATELEIYTKNKVLENALEGIAQLDESGEFEDVNAAFAKILGYNQDEIVGKKWNQFVSQQDFDRVQVGFEQAKIKRVNIEFRAVKQNGGETFVEQIILAHFDHQGKFCGYSLFVRDISHRKKSEEELTQQKNILQSILNNLGEGVIVADNKAKIISFNPMAEQILGTSLEVNNDSPFWRSGIKTVKPDKTTPYKPEELPILKAIQGKEVKNMEMYIQNSHLPEGIFINATATPLKDNEQMIKGGIVVFSDISKRKKAEEALVQSEKRFRGIFESSPIGIAVLGMEAQFSFVNSCLTEMLGYKEETIQEYNLFDIVEEHTVASCKESWKELTQDPTNMLQLEIQLKKLDQQYIWGNLRILGINDKNGKFQYAIAMLADITQRKSAEEKLKRTLGELQHSNQYLEEFVYVASHDLRAPVVNLSSLVNIYTKNRAEEKKRELIFEKIEQSVHQMDQTLHDLIEVIAYNKHINKKEIVITFSELLEEITFTLEEQIVSSNAKIISDFSDAPAISYIPSHTKSILLNLLTNAIKYRSDDRQLTINIKTKDLGEFVCLSVSDNGTGIDIERHKEKLFGLFKRLNMEVEGRGMGLFITKSLIESMGGKVEVESKLDQGTEFKVYLKKLSSSQN